jgi:hypothetical protein
MPLVSQTSSGAVVQSAFVTQWLWQTPIPPVWSVQNCTGGQSLRLGAVLQPGTHIPAGPLQMIPESGAPHSESPSTSEHPQTAVLRHCGSLGVQSDRLPPEHSRQEPAKTPLRWQAGSAGKPAQSASPWQPTQTPLLQTGAVLGQFALVRQATHSFCSVSHKGVGTAQSASETQVTQLPIVASVDVHTSDEGQPFPPVPRQPIVHLLVAPSQTRPESTVPQSASVTHPQVLSTRHAAPVPEAEQLERSVGVHSTQCRLAVSQMSGAAQSRSSRHSTQTCGVGAVSQTGSGAEQSPSTRQGWGEQVPTPPV